MQKKQIACGLQASNYSDLEETVREIQKLSYSFLVVPLVHPRYKRQLIDGKCSERRGPLTRSDMILPTTEWAKTIVGTISTHINVDSETGSIRKNSEAILKQELTLASHLGLHIVIVKVKSIRCTNLGRLLYSSVAKCPSGIIWAQLPLTYNESPHRSDVSLPTIEDDPWEWWHRLRTASNYRKQIALALELSKTIPSEAEVERWLGEPVQCLIVPTSIFLTNQHGYPVLARAMQQIVRKFLALDVQFIITGKSRHKDIQLYLSYMIHLGDMGPLVSKYAGYEDFLQFPLQPLADNLEAQVYEVFEKDPIKYKQYQLAIQKALEDRVPENKRSEITQTVMVVGAGRGPLVQAAINAGKLTGITLNVYAVEKNPHAVNTIHALNVELWNNQVKIIETDMRYFNPEHKADILVSELLGSFGDNELSPECLDGAQHVLKDNGISIPCAYTSYLAPLHSPKMLTEIRAAQPSDKTLLYCFETLYVVHLVNQYQIAPAQACWTFRHPNQDKPIDNKREVTLRFQAQQNCILTGFVGYFDTELYKGIMLSTEPRTYSEGMISWFPIFFPLQEVINIRGGDNIEVSLWRCVTDRNVWYEWCVNKPHPSVVNNVNGRSYTISL